VTLPSRLEQPAARTSIIIVIVVVMSVVAILVVTVVFMIISMPVVPIDLLEEKLVGMEIDGDAQARKANRGVQEEVVTAVGVRLIDDGASDHNGEPVQGVAMMVRLVVDPAGPVLTVEAPVARIHPARHVDVNAPVGARGHVALPAMTVSLVGRRRRNRQQDDEDPDDQEQGPPYSLAT
jgi:hypothetical protein